MKILFLTFGCSWTLGVGADYKTGMTSDDYVNIAWKTELCYEKGFRGILSQKYNLYNKNFSAGKSSNQFQFYKAKMYFSSEEFKKDKTIYDKIIVLWGITSTQRIIQFQKTPDIDGVKVNNASLSEPGYKDYLLQYYDHDNELYLLKVEINFWNSFFDDNSIKNYWFDTFNPHEYTIVENKIKNYYKQQYDLYKGEDWPVWEIYSKNYKSLELDLDTTLIKEIEFMEDLHGLYPSNDSNLRFADFDKRYDRDLLSQLANKFNTSSGSLDKKYHLSFWKQDTNRIGILKDIDLVNPYSLHPTHECHQYIADMFSKYIEDMIK